MAATGVWLTGVGVTACTLTPQTNTAGTFADTTPVANLVGNLDRVSFSSQNITENISPIDHRQQNEVIVETATTVTLTEILKKSGTNLLALAAYGSVDYFKVTLTRGAQSITFYGVVKSYEESLEKGKSVGTMVLGMVDLGATANPAYA